MLLPAGLNDVADYSPVPVGNYEFVIKEPMEITPDKDGAKSDINLAIYKLVINPEIAKGEHAGKKVRRMFTTKSKGTRYWLKSFMEKLGVSVTKEGQFNSEDLLGRRFTANVGERGYTDAEGAAKKASDLDTESVKAL